MNPVYIFDFMLMEHLKQVLEASNPPVQNIAVPVVLPPDDHIQTGQHGWWRSPGESPPVLQLLSPVMAAPSSSQTAQHREAGTLSQGQQITQYQWPADGILPAAPVIRPVDNGPSPAAMTTLPAADPRNNVPRISLPQHRTKGLQPAASLVCRNGETVCAVPPAAPQTITNNSKKRKRDDQEQPVKKPLNAFMLFLKEQRTIMAAKHNGSGSAGVNKVLGERWKLLSTDQKAKYYDQAKREAELHAERHPGFSCRENYGKRRKMMSAPTKD